MSYLTALTVFIVFSIAAFVLIMSRLILIKRQQEAKSYSKDA